MPKPIGCLILLGFLWIIAVFMPFISVLIHMYNDSPTRGKAIFWGVIILIIWFATIEIRKLYRLHKAVEDWTAIRKLVKIIDFKFANKRGWEDETTRWYYVITSDWQNNYKWMFHRWAKIYWKSEDDLMNDDFYIEEWITLDLTNRDITRQQLDQKILNLKSESQRVNLFKKQKLFMKIIKIQNKKHDLEPYHLHTHEWDFYIWDEYVLLVDPDDSNNYTFEKDKV